MPAGISAFFSMDYGEEGGNTEYFDSKKGDAKRISESIGDNLYKFIKQSVINRLNMVNPQLKNKLKEGMENVADQMRSQGDYSAYTGFQNYEVFIEAGGFVETRSWSILHLTKKWLRYKELHAGYPSHFQNTGDLFDYDVYEYIKVDSGIADEDGYSVGVNIDIEEGELTGYKLMTYGKKHVSRDFFPLNPGRQKTYGVMGMANTLMYMLVFDEVNNELKNIYGNDYSYMYEGVK